MSKNKQDLIDIMSERADIPKAAAENALNAFMDYVTRTLADGGEVNLVGWGKWETGLRAARTGRNPQTGEAIQIPEAKVTKFKAGKKLKDAVNADS